MIFLRPHHLLCLLNFQGRGYSDEFIDNMRRLLNVLKLAPDERLICTTCGCDDICKSCPKMTYEQCADDARVSYLDTAYTKAFDISVGDTISLNEVLRMAAKLPECDFRKICETCCWFELCSKLSWRDSFNSS
jgi:hypothetical protein